MKHDSKLFTNLYVYRDWKGLNMSNSWWDHHDTATMHDITYFLPYLHFLELRTDPTVEATYANDTGMDGSRFEYLNFKQTDVELDFYFTFTDNGDYLSKKQEIQSFMLAECGYIMSTNLNTDVQMTGYSKSCQIKPTTDHFCKFTWTVTNATGFWYSRPSLKLEESWNSKYLTEFRMPTDMEKPTWRLHDGPNKIFVPGDARIQLINPNMPVVITVTGHQTQQDITLQNKTNNTEITAYYQINEGKTKLPELSTYMWKNLSFSDVHEEVPLNQFTNSTNFWLNPGWNDILLLGADEAYINTRFYFNNL